MEKRIIPFFGIISITVLLLFVGGGLTSCTSSQSDAAGNSALQPGSTPSATIIPTSNNSLHCGTVTVNGLGHYNTQAPQVGQCFWHAFSKCQTATLVLVMSSVDTTTQHTFTVIKQPTNCTASDAVQHRVIPRPLGSAQTFICTRVTNNGKILEFHNCGTAGSTSVPV